MSADGKKTKAKYMQTLVCRVKTKVHGKKGTQAVAIVKH
jgi:hypothetical protein